MKFLFPSGKRTFYCLSACLTHSKSWIMKLTCLVFAISCIGIQLLMAGDSNAQRLNEVKIVLQLKNGSLRTAFTKIEEQSNFRFAYNKGQIDNYKNITLPKDVYLLDKLLVKLLEGTHLSYKVVNNKIVIFQSEDPKTDKEKIELLVPELIVKNDGIIKGKITNEKGEPLPAASAVLTGVKGVAADASGFFTISGIKPGKYTLELSAVGFQKVTREIRITDNQVLELTIQLKELNDPLNEVIVTGYSKQSKREVTGAASSISADMLAQTPVTDITTAIQGRVAGVSVDDHGGPGSAGVIRIRGVGTLGNNDPLYVIDGVQIRIGASTGSYDVGALINPSNIENITILKDPSLTALYGAEGSNGVIVITTKTGKKGEPKFEYNTYVADQFITKFPKMSTPQQQADALYKSYAVNGQAFPFTSFYGSGSTPVLPDYIIESATSNVGVASGSTAADPSLYNFSGYRILQANKSGTDWWKTLFKPALSQNHQLSVSGATDKSNYAVSFNYNDDKGTLLNSYFKRLSLRINTDFKIKPWLKTGETLEVSYATGNSISMSFNNNIAALYGLSPLLPVYDIKGKMSGLGGAPVLGSSVFGSVNNPFIDRNNATNSKNYTEAIIGAAYIEAEPVKGLTYQSKIGFQFVPNQSHSLADSVIQNAIPSRQTYFYENSNYYTDWRWLNKIAYTTTIDRVHKLSAFVAYESRENRYRYLSVVVDSLISTASNFQYVNSGFSNPNYPAQGSGTIQTSTSEFGNVSYSYSDKYLFSGTIRRDGSSIFGSNHKYGVFPAASAGWRLSREKFMAPVKWLNDLKVRASWGKAGNDAITTGRQYNLINSINYIYGGYDLGGTNISQVLGSYPSQVGNPDLHWETNITTNLGFDAALLQNRLSLSFNWFNRKTEDLLYQAPYTGIAGAASAPYRNIMSFTNKGMELEISFKGNDKSKLKYEMSFNISGYKSNINYIDGDSSTHIDLAGFAPTSYSLTRNVVDHPVSSFYGYVHTGIFQSAADYTSNGVSQPGLTAANAMGHFKFKDLNHDGVINNTDQTFLGNPNPKFSYGYNLNLYYKNIDFNIFVQGVYGNKIFNYWRSRSRWPGSFTTESLDTWSPTNTKAGLPVYSQDGINNNNDNVPSDFFVESGSYLRLKSAQLGYTFPKSKAFSRLRVYVQAFNLFTITHYTGLDPEVNTGDPGSLGIDYGTQYPMSRKLLFGVNLTF